MNQNLIDTFGRRFTDDDEMINALQEMYDSAVNSVKDFTDAAAAIGMCMGDMVNRNADLLELDTQITSQQMPRIDFSHVKYGEGVLAYDKPGNKVLRDWANEIRKIESFPENNAAMARTFCVDYYVWLQATRYTDAFEKFRQVVYHGSKAIHQTPPRNAMASEDKPKLYDETKFIHKYVAHLHTFNIDVFYTRFEQIGNHIASALEALDGTSNADGTEKWDDIMARLHRWFFMFLVYSLWMGKVRDISNKNSDIKSFMFMKLMTDRIHKLMGKYKKSDMSKYGTMANIWDLNNALVNNMIMSGVIITNVSPERKDLVKRVRRLFSEVEIRAQVVTCGAMLVHAGYSMPVLSDIFGFRAVHVISDKTENMYMELYDAIIAEFEKIRSFGEVDVVYNVADTDSLQDLLCDGEKVNKELMEFEQQCKDMEKELLNKTVIYGEDAGLEAVQIAEAAQHKVQQLITKHNSIMDIANG